MRKLKWRPLGKILVEQKIVLEDQLEKALRENRLNKKGLTFNLVHMGFADEPLLM